MLDSGTTQTVAIDYDLQGKALAAFSSIDAFFDVYKQSRLSYEKDWAQLVDDVIDGRLDALAWSCTCGNLVVVVRSLRREGVERHVFAADGKALSTFFARDSAEFVRDDLGTDGVEVACFKNTPAKAHPRPSLLARFDAASARLRQRNSKQTTPILSI